MSRHLVSRLGIGLLLSVLVIGALLPAERATAAEDAAEAVGNTKHHSEAKDTPTIREPHRRRCVALEVLCRVQGEGRNIFTKDGKITLVLDKGHADYRMADTTAETINSQLSFYSRGMTTARALDRANIEVTLPAEYREDPVAFISQVLSVPIPGPELDATLGGCVRPVEKDGPIAASARRGDRITLRDICRVRGEGANIFTERGKITLVLREDRATYRMAHEAAELVNSQLSFQNDDKPLAKALDRANIEVTLPTRYRDDAVQFISQMLSLRMPPKVDSQVVVTRGAQ